MRACSPLASEQIFSMPVWPQQYASAPSEVAAHASAFTARCCAAIVRVA